MVDPSATALTTRYCIVGAGPAGMMLGWLLARAGQSVVVLEKHADFFRDFRGDTLHPSTLEVFDQLGELDALLAVPHDEVRELRGEIEHTAVTLADFRHLPTRCRFLALMPQWDFLSFLAERARTLPTFALHLQSEVVELLWDGRRVAGVRAQTPDGPRDVRAELVIAADGRTSVVRERAGLVVEELGAPMDVLWFRLSRRPTDPPQTFGRFAGGRILIFIGRRDYWQCGFVIRKGSADELRARGLAAFHHELAELAPFLEDRLCELASWDDVRQLTVELDRLRRWYRAGLLCIGDAAHAMSPIGGVGINLAVQDAVAAANVLAGAEPRDIATLRAVQRRREWPTKVTQGVQAFVQRAVVERMLSGAAWRPPRAVLLLLRVPPVRWLVAYAVGVGVRPERVARPRRTRR